MLLKTVSLLRGYAKFEVTGGFPERFLNLCAAKQRDVWDIRHTNNGFTALVRASEYKNLRSDARASGVRMRVKEKRGFPFMLRKHRFRVGFFLGFFLFFATIYYLSGFAWNINISGLKNISQEELLKVLEHNGIYAGARLSSIDEPNVRQNIILECPDISWMSINPVGTTLNIDLKERVYAPDKKSGEPSNLIASCDGLITSMQVEEGSAVVKVGDAVVSGELLVSGAVEYSNGCTVLKEASAVITAETRHVFSASIPFEQTINVRTGKVKTKSVFHFFGLNIPLYLTGESGTFEKETSRSDLTICGKSIPIGITKTSFYEVQETLVTFSEDEIAAQAMNKIEKEFSENFPEAEIISKEEERNIADGQLSVSVIFKCKENIGLREKLLIF